MTTKEFINNLDFSYFKTYSLLRLEESRKYYNGLDSKLKNELDEIERRKIVSLRIRGTKALLLETRLPHPTAKQINVFTRESSEYQSLQQILNIQFVQQHNWMCAPVFREMIVFYDKNNAIVALLNVCLSCDRIEDEFQNDIKTDYTVFDKLRVFFLNIGHIVEDK